MRRTSSIVFVVALALVIASSSARPADRPATLGVYGGLGSWLDIFAGRVWWEPNTVVAALRAHGVGTLYLQTSNYSQRADVVRPAAVAGLIDAAHAAGIDVVGWYLPSFTNQAVDARRSLAAMRFRTPSGQHYDSFALDIEATLVRNVSPRNARLLALSRLIRSSSPVGYPLGAIIPSPVGMRHHPHYWPSFPYAELAQSFDAILPMAYFTHYTRSPNGAYAYAHDVVTAIRARTGRPNEIIHLIGGLASGAPPAAFAAFDQAASDCGVDGLSFYEFPLTTASEWSLLSETPLGQTVQPSCAG